MKPTLLLLLMISLASCAPSKVCGGSSGKRCVDVSMQTNSKNIS